MVYLFRILNLNVILCDNKRTTRLNLLYRRQWRLSVYYYFYICHTFTKNEKKKKKERKIKWNKNKNNVNDSDDDKHTNTHTRAERESHFTLSFSLICIWHNSNGKMWGYNINDGILIIVVAFFSFTECVSVCLWVHMWALVRAFMCYRMNGCQFGGWIKFQWPQQKLVFYIEMSDGSRGTHFACDTPMNKCVWHVYISSSQSVQIFVSDVSCFPNEMNFIQSFLWLSIADRKLMA